MIIITRSFNLNYSFTAETQRRKVRKINQLNFSIKILINKEFFMIVLLNNFVLCVLAFAEGRIRLWRDPSGENLV